jgi:hypothetical protein
MGIGRWFEHCPPYYPTSFSRNPCFRRSILANILLTTETILDDLERAPRAEVNRALRELFEAVYVDNSGKIVRLVVNY